MTRSAKLLLVAFLWGWRAVAADLTAQLDAIIDGPAFAQAQWGVKVCALDSGATIYARNADKLLKPASNGKIYTAALALDRLGPDFRIKTSVYAAAPPDAQGVIQGDVTVYGRGDPSFSARFNGGDYTKALQPLLDAFAKAGIKRIEGDLIGDETYFSGPPYGADWTWDDLENYYGAPTSALTLQDNVIDLQFEPAADVGAPCRIITHPETSFIAFSNFTQTIASGEAHFRLFCPLGENVAYVWGQAPLHGAAHTDAIPVQQPALWFVTMLKEGLAQRGIVVAGNVRVKTWLDRASGSAAPPHVEVASVEGRPISEIVKQTLKPSENLYAQLLLLQVGAKNPLINNGDTAEAGLHALRFFLTGAGIGSGLVALSDGSGLSRGSLVTPSASVQLLTRMAHHSAKDAFVNALPIGGVDGTLRNRFKGTAAAGNVRAKTGSLQYVDTLSGYLTNKAGGKLVFSIMLNNYREPSGGPSGRAAIDSLVRLLVDSQ